MAPYHTHQVVALPVIQPEVTPWIVHQGQCLVCGKRSKTALPAEHTSGDGPRRTAVVGEMAGGVSISRSAGQELCASVFSMPMSQGAMQKMAGTFARRLDRAQEALWLFLDILGIDPTNNAAERAHRFGVMGRKRSQRTCREQGNRWVELVLSCRHTCRIRGRSTFPLLVEAVT